MTTTRPEISWFAALCDDDYEFLGVPDPELASSYEHCGDIVRTADQLGFDNILCPSGYTLGIDTIAFASAMAPQVEQMQLLTAVRIGEMWPPQLARQLATIDQMLGGRLTINIISSDIPGEELDRDPRYQRTLEHMKVLRALLNRETVTFDGESIQLDELAPSRIGTVSNTSPPFYFGGFSDQAKDVAAEAADVFLTWPDTVASVGETVAEMTERAAGFGRELQYGLRTHVIVRETEGEAMDAAARLVSKLDADMGVAIKSKSLDTGSEGVSRQNALRANAGTDGFAEENLWTGIGRARSGAGAAIVGDPDQVAAKLRAYMDVGVGAFILSGYPHIAEAKLFAEHVLPQFDHGPLFPRV